MVDKDKIFAIRIADDGSASPDPITLSYGNNQRVVWVSDAELAKEIKFDKPSPFGKNSQAFDLPAKGSCDPGPITLKKHATYYYVIELKGATAKSAAADPTIIITK